MIGIVDYGLGNVQAFANIYRRLGIEAKPAKTPEEVAEATKLILPGVGAFDWAMARLTQSGVRDALDKAVLARGVPVLGVCVGMQMMADRSEEGALPGLGWIGGDVVRFRMERGQQRTPLPHMGWNDVQPTGVSLLFEGLDSPRFYFLHSFHLRPNSQSDQIATTDYGLEFTSAVGRANIFGTQFHPEKSHAWGIRLLKNFAEIVA